MPDEPITKYPFEKKDYSFSFSPQLEANETIELVSCEAIDLGTPGDGSAALISSEPPPVVNGQQVVFWLEDGNGGDQYDMIFKVESSRGQKLQGKLRVVILQER
jgi:hypothetical protein